MSKGRLEAFSDGVIAIIITIMVLELHAPAGAELSDLRSLAEPVLSYAISFVLVGTYWVNHHHLLQVTERISGRVLWCNLLFLFVMSLIPVATGWINNTHFAQIPTLVYVVLNMLTSLTYLLLERSIVAAQPGESKLHLALNGRKERRTFVVELAALISAVVPMLHPLAYPCLILSVMFWMIPDLRIVVLMRLMGLEGEEEKERQEEFLRERMERKADRRTGREVAGERTEGASSRRRSRKRSGAGER